MRQRPPLGTRAGRPGTSGEATPPRYVKPFVRGNKNDYNDVLAIAEAVIRPEMRFVSVKHH